MRHKSYAIMSKNLIFSPKQYIYHENGTNVARWTVVADDQFQRRWYCKDRLPSLAAALAACETFANQNVKGQFLITEWDASPGVVSRGTVGIIPGLIVKEARHVWED